MLAIPRSPDNTGNYETPTHSFTLLSKVNSNVRPIGPAGRTSNLFSLPIPETVSKNDVIKFEVEPKPTPYPSNFKFHVFAPERLIFNDVLLEYHPGKLHSEYPITNVYRRYEYCQGMRLSQDYAGNPIWIPDCWTKVDDFSKIMYIGDVVGTYPGRENEWSFPDHDETFVVQIWLGRAK